MSISYIYSYIVGIVTITIVVVNERDKIISVNKTPPPPVIYVNSSSKVTADSPQSHHVLENSTKFQHQDLGLV